VLWDQLLESTKCGRHGGKNYRLQLLVRVSEGAPPLAASATQYLGLKVGNELRW
jgi:hypothetical protein